MGSRTKVIVVEDEHVIAQHIGFVLQDAGYEVVGMAANADETLSLVERQSPVVAVMDVALLGDLDGVTLGGELTERYGIYVVYVTGDPLSVCRRAWQSRNQVLSKPFSDVELLRAVERATMRDNSARGRFETSLSHREA